MKREDLFFDITPEWRLCLWGKWNLEKEKEKFFFFTLRLMPEEHKQMRACIILGKWE